MNDSGPEPGPQGRGRVSGLVEGHLSAALGHLVPARHPVKGGDVEWKVYLDGEEPDLARLGRQLTSDEVASRLDDSGWYLQSEQFEVLDDADDVGLGANALLAQINGVATLMIGGYRRVGPAGRIVRGSSAFIFVDDHIRIVCDITANGVVTDSEGCI